MVALSGATGDPVALRLEMVELLRPVVGFDRWCWPVCDPASGLATTALGEHDYWAVLPRLLLLDQRLDADDALPALAAPRATGRRNPGLRFTDVLGPVGIGDELRVPLRDRHGLWGCLDLMRSSDDPPFSEDDVALLHSLSEALARVTRRGSAVGGASPPSALSAGVLVLDAELDVRAATPSARAWLGELAPPGMPFADMAAAAVVYNLAARVFARGAAGRAQEPASARVRSITGSWAVVEADDLDPFEQTVAVTIRPAFAAEILDLRLLAFDLTAREREVVALLVDGNDTRTVSDRLFLSPHTIQDHLKSIFVKTGARTRKELVATLAR